MKNIIIHGGIFLLLIFWCLAFIFGCKKDNSTAPNSSTAVSVSAKDYLNSSNYDKLVIQIQYVNGYQPTSGAVDDLKTFLSQRLNKPAGVEVTYSNINSPGRTVYSLDDVKAVESLNRAVKTEGKTITAYVLFLDGDYSQNNGNLKTLGVAYSSSSMVIFEKTLRDLSGGLGQPTLGSVEATVSEHEFGHILGLVNNGTNMTVSHQDEPHGKHCNNSNCLMYYMTETSDMISNLLGNNVPVLDANCINDLKANGGK
ncbi:MAG: peptidase [Bacteroidetes bacterium]|nr:peptidase [Bacteroidota bacterium]